MLNLDFLPGQDLESRWGACVCSWFHRHRKQSVKARYMLPGIFICVWQLVLGLIFTHLQTILHIFFPLYTSSQIYIHQFLSDHTSLYLNTFSPVIRIIWPLSLPISPCHTYLCIGMTFPINRHVSLIFVFTLVFLALHICSNHVTSLSIFTHLFQP